MSKAKRKKVLDDPLTLTSSTNQVLNGLTESIHALQSIDLFSDHKLKLLEVEPSNNYDEFFLWLCAKFGVGVILRLTSFYDSLPLNGLTQKQRLKLITDVFPNLANNLESILSIIDGCQQASNLKHETQIILCPPIDECTSCKQKLVMYHQCLIRIYTTRGLRTAKKFTLRCKKCSILFNYAMYGNKEATGFQFYHSEREYIEVSDTLYFERRLLEWQCSLA